MIIQTEKFNAPYTVKVAGIAYTYDKLKQTTMNYNPYWPLSQCFGEGNWNNEAINEGIKKWLAEPELFQLVPLVIYVYSNPDDRPFTLFLHQIPQQLGSTKWWMIIA